MTFKDLIEDLLEKNDMSKAELSRLLGIPQSQLSQWLSGYRGIGKNYLFEMSKIFRVPVEYLEPDKSKLYTTGRQIPPSKQDAIERKILSVINDLPDDFKKDILEYCIKTKYITGMKGKGWYEKTILCFYAVYIDRMRIEL